VALWPPGFPLSTAILIPDAFGLLDIELWANIDVGEAPELGDCIDPTELKIWDCGMFLGDLSKYPTDWDCIGGFEIFGGGSRRLRFPGSSKLDTDGNDILLPLDGNESSPIILRRRIGRDAEDPCEKVLAAEDVLEGWLRAYDSCCWI
jgi:hypothetical protein